jgi:A/G-specific adenine glycosylase
MTTEEQISFQNAVWSLYRDRGRDFPWRHVRDPYAVMVSEFMLQQTQTERVVPKYTAWLSAFPDAAAVAAAPLSEIYARWNGLGYNRRARFLQESCRALVLRNGFPRTAAELETLPGIGPYTARAISAFAFNNPEVVIETNIRSVFIFTFFRECTEKIPDSRLLPLIEQTLDRENPREWYYALMDYGAELKKQVQNPARKSAHYAKQSRFAGSLRQARGAIIRQLSRQDSGEQEKGLTLPQIGLAEQLDAEQLARAAAALVQEGVIVIHDDTLTIAGN